MHEHSEGYSARLTVITRAFPPLTNAIIFGPARMQIEGPNSRRDVARHCEERAGSEIDWVAYVSTACTLALERIESGNPMVNLAEVEPVHDLPLWQVQPILRQGENVLLYGDGKSGKSIYALYLACCMSVAQSSFSGPTNPAVCCYLDYEDEEATHRYRIEKIAKGMGLAEVPDVFYKHVDTSFTSLVSSLGRELYERGVNFMIVDSAALACGDEPEKAGPANAYFRALRSLHLPLGSLTIGHRAKDKGRERFPFGSIYWYNTPRRLWTVRKKQEPGEKHITVGLWNTNSNNGSEEMPIAYRLRFDEDAFRFQSHDVGKVLEFRDKLSLPKRIELALLEKGPLLYSELAEQVCQTVEESRAFSPRLAEMKKANRIVKLPDGRWAVAARTPEEV